MGMRVEGPARSVLFEVGQELPGHLSLAAVCTWLASAIEVYTAVVALAA